MSDRKLVMWSMVGVVALAAVGALAIWLIRDKSVSCRTWEANVPNSYGHKLITVNSACEGIASSDAVSIELVNARGDRVRVFEYGTAYSFVKDGCDATPVFRWVDKNNLEISVKKISYLKHSRDRVDDVRINLHIGEIEFK